MGIVWEPLTKMVEEITMGLPRTNEEGTGTPPPLLTLSGLEGKPRNEVSRFVGDVLRRLAWAAVGDLAASDMDLLALGAHEQALCHRLAVYLERRTQGFHVDCEYNRYKTNPKRRSVANERRLMKPDILLHRRLVSDFNMMALEAKANANPDGRGGEDTAKLEELTDPQEPFHYHLGVHVVVYNERREVLTARKVRVKLRWCVDRQWVGEKEQAFDVDPELIARLEAEGDGGGEEE